MSDSLAGAYVARTNFHTPHGHFVPGDIVHLTHEDAERAICHGTVELSADALGVTVPGPDEPEACWKCAKLGHACSVECFVASGQAAEKYDEYLSECEGAVSLRAPAVPTFDESDDPTPEPVSKSQQKRAEILKKGRS